LSTYFWASLLLQWFFWERNWVVDPRITQSG
jgi:hypothetical protein